MALALPVGGATPRKHGCFVDCGQPGKWTSGGPRLLGWVFVLEVARFMYPQQHFGLVDNDCVPVTLFEVPDLVALATSQMQWIDLVGLAPDDPKHNDKVASSTTPDRHFEAAEVARVQLPINLVLKCQRRNLLTTVFSSSPWHDPQSIPLTVLKEQPCLPRWSECPWKTL